MKKLTDIILIAMLVVMIFAGCSGRGNAVKPEPTAAQLASDMLAALTMEDELMEISDEVIENIYEIDDEEIAEYKVYVSSSGSTAEEVSVFKAAGKDGISYIETLIELRVQNQKISFQDYVPEEMVKIGSPLILKNGNFVALVLANDTKPAEKVFNSAF